MVRRAPAKCRNELQCGPRARRESRNRVRYDVRTSLLFKATVISEEQKPNKERQTDENGEWQPSTGERCERRNQHQSQAQASGGTSEDGCSHHLMHNRQVSEDIAVFICCRSWKTLKGRGNLVLPDARFAIRGKQTGPPRFDPAPSKNCEQDSRPTDSS
jgi:hypothetical protein